MLKKMSQMVFLLIGSLLLPQCGNPGSSKDGNNVCTGIEDCQEGFICKDGTCVERPPCSDFDQDGYCDQREGGDDCNDNRADIHPGAPELCDGVDNDCDSQIDEDCPCKLGDKKACGINIGICKTGTMTCDNGQWGECKGGRQPDVEENCEDNLDNDCNGSINDNCVCLENAPTRSCGLSFGECTSGTQSCILQNGEWRWSKCEGGTPATEEICNDLVDNDCDGGTDEGCPCAERQRPCGINIGYCHAGVQNCENSIWGDCIGARFPQDEICDGIDNDCDRLTDEDCECVEGLTDRCGGSDVGECRFGTHTCIGGNWGSCEGEITPLDRELCDGKDNDCDGQTDEDFPQLGNECNAGEGICRRIGRWVCNLDQINDPGVHCSAKPGQPETEEKCDCLDNNCDGQTDEGFPGVGEDCSIGLGDCYSTGVTVCSCDGLGGLMCNAAILQPQSEKCDGHDNDCDSSTDENFPLLGQDCSIGTGKCFSQGHYICASNGDGIVCDAPVIEPSGELCNRIDDDCDGQTDEEWYETCSSDCEDGYRFCVDGAPGECSARQPTAEVCDGIDNNCDGFTDEIFTNLGQSCQAGVGACLSLGYIVCDYDNGSTMCNAVPGTPQPEGQVDTEGRYHTCVDGIDNDCDGTSDCVETECKNTSECGGCPDVSMRDLAPLQLVGGGLGIVIGRRRKRKSKGNQDKDGVA